MAAHVLDDYYLGITAIVTVAFQLFFFFIAYALQFDKVTGTCSPTLSLAQFLPLLTISPQDLAGGSNFAILAVLTLALGGYQHDRQLVVSLLMIVWAVRLAGFLFFRILKSGHDERFNEMRGKFLSFLGFWIFQMLWVWIVSLPVTLLNSPAVTRYDEVPFGTGRDIAGVILFGVGFVMETLSDAQKYIFRSTHDGKAVCSGGFFAISRHPNYFGEIIQHFGVLISFSAFKRLFANAAKVYTSLPCRPRLTAMLRVRHTRHYMRPLSVLSSLRFFSCFSPACPCQSGPRPRPDTKKATTGPSISAGLTALAFLSHFRPGCMRRCLYFSRGRFFSSFRYMFLTRPNTRMLLSQEVRRHRERRHDRATRGLFKLYINR